jgi:hypothetical protein
MQRFQPPQQGKCHTAPPAADNKHQCVLCEKSAKTTMQLAKHSKQQRS